jgi:hypothetical protein
MRKLLLLILSFSLFAAAGTSASAGFFLQGARKAKADPQDVIAKYDIEPCVMIADGSPAGAPGAEYWLFEESGELRLFERSGRGDGAIIENHWKDEDGDHFFAWVRSSHGWEYIIPENRTADAVRFVYVKGSYGGENNEQGARVPRGEPAARCYLKPSFVAEEYLPEPKPAPAVPEPEPAPEPAVVAAPAPAAKPEPAPEPAVVAAPTPAVRPEPAPEPAVVAAPAPAASPEPAPEPAIVAAPAPAARPEPEPDVTVETPTVCLMFSAVGSRGLRESEWTCSKGYADSEWLWVGDDSGYRRQQLRIRNSGPDEICIRHSDTGRRGLRESEWACSLNDVPSIWIGLGDDSGYRRQQLAVRSDGPIEVCMRFTKTGRRGRVETEWSCSRRGLASEWIPLSDDSGYRDQQFQIRVVEPM